MQYAVAVSGIEALQLDAMGRGVCRKARSCAPTAAARPLEDLRVRTRHQPPMDAHHMSTEAAKQWQADVPA